MSRSSHHSPSLGFFSPHKCPIFADHLQTGLTSEVTAGSSASGGAHSCALTTLGGLKCWGWNGFGQLGDGTTTDRSTAVDVIGLVGGVAAVSAGGSHTCALTGEAGLKCWGRNNLGQLGDGTTVDGIAPVDVIGFSGNP